MQCIVSACVETVFHHADGKRGPFSESLVACINGLRSFATIGKSFNWNDFLLAFCQYVKKYMHFTYFLLIN